ncbi:reverse transcriptase domain-containing protein [Tanacetum coccineum]
MHNFWQLVQKIAPPKLGPVKILHNGVTVFFDTLDTKRNWVEISKGNAFFDWRRIKTYPTIKPRVKWKRNIAWTKKIDRRKLVKDEVAEWLKARIVRKIDWKIESLMGFKYKCFLDAYKGYHQIQMTKKDEEKTAFHTDEGVFCYTKMPFGLKNAGATYQRLVDTIFEGQMGRNLEAYVDDMVIKSKTEPEMIKDIEETLLTLKKGNLEKAKAVVNMPSPSNLKQMQRLSGKLAALNRFLSKVAEKALPYLDTLKKCTNKKDFHWTAEAEEAFQEMKSNNRATNLHDPTEGKRTHGLPISGQRSSQHCYISGKTGETSPNPLRHTITNKPISQILNNREATGRLAKCGIELEDYSIKYAPRSAIKGLVLADFLADTMAEDNSTQVKASRQNDTLREGKSREEHEAPETKTPKNLGTETDIWKLYIDGASNEHRSGAGLILIDPEGAKYSYALRLNFSNSNNDAEYEAMLAGLIIAAKMKVEKMHAYVDSKWVASQVEGSYKAKNNKKADALSKLATVQSEGLTKGVLIKELNEQSVDTVEVNTIMKKQQELG